MSRFALWLGSQRVHHGIAARKKRFRGFHLAVSKPWRRILAPSETGAKSKIELIGAACQLMFLAGGNHQFAGRWPASSAWPSAAGLNCRLAPRAFFVWAGATGSHTSERVKPRPKDRNFGTEWMFASVRRADARFA